MNAKTDLGKWGFNFYEENVLDGHHVIIEKLNERGDIRVHEMLGLAVQWAQGRIVCAGVCDSDHDTCDKLTHDTDTVDMLLSTGVHGCPGLNNLPCTIRPTISYFHQIDHKGTVDDYPLIYSYEVDQVHVEANLSPSASSSSSISSANCSSSAYAAAASSACAAAASSACAAAASSACAATASSACAATASSACAAADSPSSNDKFSGLFAELELSNKQRTFTEVFVVRGCKKKEARQAALTECATLPVMPSCRVVPHPGNTADKNAIKVEIELKHVFTLIGYISVNQILKVKNALDKSEIISVDLNKPKLKKNKNSDLSGYFCTINITKKNQWDDDDPDAYYNMPLP